MLRSTLAALVIGTLATATALARSEKAMAYRPDEVWPATVRFLIVDEHVTIRDKDVEAGYVMFDLKDDGKTFRGSLEVVPVVRDNRTTVRFVLQIEDRPDWIEVAMLTRLERKLRAELGAPAAPAPPRAPSPPPADDKPAPPPATDDGPPISPTP
jgi:hypothetical protein